MKVLHRGLEVMDWDSVQKSLRQFAGVNLDKNRRIPSNWVIVKEEILTGEKGNFVVRMAVFPETFTGFAKGKGQQSAGGFMGAGSKNLGIEIEVEDLSTGEIGSDRTFGDISFDRQDEFFRDALTVISRTITAVSSVASPHTRLVFFCPSFRFFGISTIFFPQLIKIQHYIGQDLDNNGQVFGSKRARFRQFCIQSGRF